jgi:hypothetical protein
MRRILVNRSNARRASKRGGDNLRVTLNEEVAPAGGGPDDDILALDAALTEFAQTDARRAKVMELHYVTIAPASFCGDTRGASRPRSAPY